MHPKERSAKFDQDRIERNVSKKLNDSRFLGNLAQLKKLIAQGCSVDEARRSLPRMNTNQWNQYLHALGTTSHTPSRLYIEYYVKAKVRLELTIDMYNTAKKEKDLRTQMTAIMTMVKIDESLLQWAQSLGVIRPEEKPIDGGHGIDDASLKDEYAKLEREITDRLRDEERARFTIPAALLEEPVPKRDDNQLGQTPVDVKPS